ncbi:TonB-dependent receptor [Sphingomonas lacunae]|uniref:TonB-dependent receptor n=1 Tax=Sphingomonas lacunae TaxID=2698828 RepID=A0A6M4AW51_9SPHN|nr:TonB-dependent receptor [Sphingomonas lacunae]
MRLSLLLASTSLSITAPAFAQSVPAQPAVSATATDGDDFHTTNEELVVTAPFARSLDLFGNIGIVQGNELAREMRPQIGDMLARQPGVSATSFSPGSSRPVLRGLQGDRVRIMTDGLGSLDASNTSVDHAVAIDPLTAERVEIVHGPASLLFGSSATGGAVNIFDRRIPRAMPESPLHIDAIANYASASSLRSGGASFDLPIGSRLVWHVDGNYSQSGDMRIGGFQVAPGLRDELLDEAAEELAEGHAEEAEELTEAANRRNRVPNSATESWSAGTGLALITDTGSLGVSIGYLDSRYGVPGRPGAGHHHDHGAPPVAGAAEPDHGEEDVTIGLKQWRADIRGEVELGNGFFERLRIRAGFADYQHIEFEGDEVGTTFLNQGLEGRAELVQADHDGWRGATGVQYFFRDFNAIGAEAFVPQNDTEQFALFTFQEVTLGPVSLEAAGRFEHSQISANASGISRSFNAWSGAVGVSHGFGNNSKVGVNISRTERAPAAEELLSDGPHIATQSYEVGDPDFGLERSVGLEAYAKLRTDAVNLSITAFANWFDNFIYARETGGTIDDLPVFSYAQTDARFVGLEIEAEAPLLHVGGFTLLGNITADMVRARLANGGGNVPRIPPARVRGGVELRGEMLTVAGEVEWTAKQDRIAAYETATEGFTMVNASIDWKPLGPESGVSLILSANNIFDVIGRRHASFTKDFVPLSGRDIRATVRFSF